MVTVQQDKGLTDKSSHRSWAELNDSQALVKLNNVIGGSVETLPRADVLCLVPLTSGGNSGDLAANED